MTQHPMAQGPYDPPPVLRDQIAPLDIAALLRVFWYGKWIVALTTLCTTLLGGYYAFEMTGPRFAATAKLQVDAQPLGLQDVAQQWPDPGTDTVSLNTEVTMLTATQVLGQIVAELDLIADPEFNRYLTPASPYAINSLRSRLRHFLAGTQEVPPDQAAVLEKTIQNLRGAVTATRLRDTYLFQITAHSRSPEKAALIANTAAQIYVADQIRAKDDAAQAAITWLSDRVHDLQQQLQTQETAVTRLIATAQLQDDKRLDLLSDEVLRIEQDLDEAQSALVLITASASPTPTSRATAEITQQRDEIAKITAQRDRLRAQLAGQSAGLVQLNQIQREAEATRVLYESFLARLQETRIQQGLARPDAQIITVAAPGQYAGPRKLQIIALAALLGVCLGIGLLIMRQSLRRGVLTAADLRDATGLPVIAQLPHSLPRRSHALIKTLQDRHIPAITGLRAALKAGVQADSGQVILSTAALPDEGKPAQTLGLVISLVRSGKAVLFLGADPQTLLPGGTSSLKDVIAGDLDLADAVTTHPELQADILSVAATDYHADIFLDDGFGVLLGNLRQRYDYIIVDAPPVLTNPETAILAQQADTVLYAVRWAKTPVAVVESGLRILQDAGAPAPALVLSQVNQRKSRQMGKTIHGGHVQTVVAI